MKKPKIHLICNAHLDPVWQWRWEEGCSEAISTFRSTVQIINEHKKLIFNHNEAVLYQWVQKYEPGLFAEIQNLVKESRWCISGGWYLQPDVNMPGTESLIRNIFEGRKYFKKYFNVEPKVAYNFDSFGHSSGLPQIMNQSGYKMYIHMRPQQNDIDIPSDLYRWRGSDGSEILVLRIVIGLYHTEYDNIKQRIQEGKKLALRLNRDVPVFWGIGDHGGGATREDLKIIDEIIHKENEVEIIHSTPDILYETLKDEAENSPVVEGDLQRVFIGCYTSVSQLKRASQKSMAELVQTEALTTAAWWAFDSVYLKSEIHSAWLEHMFNDFHDILPGSCTEPAANDALNLYGKISETIKRLRFGAAVNFNSGKPEEAYIPVTVMNSNPACANVPIEFECMISHRPKWKGKWHIKLFDQKGKEIPCQEEQPEALLSFNGWRRKISFMADLPSLGSQNYTAEAVEGIREQEKCVPKIKFGLNKQTGFVDSLLTERGSNILNGNLFEPLVIDDTGDSWGTDLWSYRNVTGKFQLVENSLSMIEKGPVRNIHESIFTYGNSKIIMHTIAYSEWNVLEVRFRIHWNEEKKRLKFSIPTVFDNDNILCEVSGGIITRPADGDEHVHGRWCYLSGNIQGEDSAVAVINNGQYGIDYKNGEVRLSVLRSAAFCHEQGFKLNEFPYRKYSDIGIHEVILLVSVGKPEEVLKNITGLADWLSSPPVIYAHLPLGNYTNKNNGLKSEYETTKNLISISPANIRLLAFKQSEDEKSLIIRLQETTGKITIASIKLNYHFDEEIIIPFNPLQIRTLRFERDGSWKEVNMISEI